MTPDAKRQTDGLRMILKSRETGRIFCAVNGKTVVAMVSILFTVSTSMGGRAAWLEDMVVAPDCRGKGIGAKLLTHAIEQAERAGCKRVMLLTDSVNGPAMHFYERAGFARSGMTPFRKHLPGKAGK